MKSAEKITATVGEFTPRPQTDKPSERAEGNSIADKPFNELLGEIIEKAYPQLMR